MSRLFAPLALIALIPLGSTGQAARHGGSSNHSTSRPSTSGHSGFTPSAKTGTNPGIKPSSNTVNPVTATNTNSSAQKFVSKPPVPSTVKAPGKNSTGFVSTKQYAANFGVKFKRGTFYRGLNHRHWSARHFNPRWRTWFWYCPSTCGWYYWCGDKSCYLPCNMISSYPPEQGEEEDTTPPDGDEVPRISDNEAPDVPNPEGIE
jgi:hypothetical protein